MKKINASRLKLLFICLCLLSILLSIITFIFSYTIYFSNQQYNLWYFEKIRESWISGPIYSIVASDTPCSNSNSELINQRWELTFEGCDYPFFQNCSYFDSNNSPLVLSDEKNFVNNLNITKWKSKHYCIRRLNWNYFNMSLVDKNTKCDSGEQKCGIIDSLGNYLCLPIDEVCPKTVQEFQNILNFNYNFSSQYDYNDLMKNFSIRGNDYNNHIITETFVRRNPVCYSYSTSIRDTIKVSYFNFDFAHECSKINGTVFDKRIFLFDYYNISKIYSENDIYSRFQKSSLNLIDELRDKSMNVNGFLFVKNYPGINLKCLNNDTVDDSSSNSNNINNNFRFNENDLKAIQSVQAFLFCEFLCILFNGVFIIIEIVIFKFNWFRPRENKDDLIELKYILNSYRLVKKSVAIGYFFLVFITTLVSSIYYYTLSKAIFEITNLFGNKNCVDPITFSLLDHTCKALFIKRDNYSGPLIFSASYLLVYIFTICYSDRVINKLSNFETDNRNNEDKNDLINKEIILEDKKSSERKLRD